MADLDSTIARRDSRRQDGFVPFFRRYTKTWVHAVATAGLTAFGTLTFVHRWFVALALASYVVPPAVLYVQQSGDDVGKVSDDTAETATAANEREISADESESDTHDTRDDETDSQDDEPKETDGPSVRWRSVDFDADATLFDVVITERDVAYAVGAGGIVGTDGGTESWSILLEDGPSASANDLWGADATDDGDAVWVAGNSGAVGRLDVGSGRHTDYTAPREITDNILGVAAGGSAGEETVLLITGSGAVIRGRYRDGGPEWNEPLKPGGGSSLSAVVLVDGSTGYCCDTNDGVFATDDGGESFTRIGPAGADGTLEGVAADDRLEPMVCADDGVVRRFDGSTWTPERVVDGSLSGIDHRNGRTVACDTDGGIHERRSDERSKPPSWEHFDTDAAAVLAVSIGPERSVAVGEGGTVLRRTDSRA
ncbi:hypothetical protein EA462_01510 [Natrarchaeobius halalkaliphilus]|uniref:Photosynthesis system II assembly factor Ycf48/Hcf136-like domain-containing protein n=1 Tax=Natrarchaeobius halalkaliphilus TaxID=1679091 RepID=A0A3N6MG67_9EURY|nr:hypothetical protein [Natrarchaeobius halalkaliphilus]RQG92926.1 hypothetical protein EA462_01510 [Natrarchaeobius halalkaliphilus]